MCVFVYVDIGLCVASHARTYVYMSVCVYLYICIYVFLCTSRRHSHVLAHIFI